MSSGFKQQTFNLHIKGVRLALEPPFIDEKWRPREVRTPAKCHRANEGRSWT